MTVRYGKHLTEHINVPKNTGFSSFQFNTVFNLKGNSMMTLIISSEIRKLLDTFITEDEQKSIKS